MKRLIFLLGIGVVFGAFFLIFGTRQARALDENNCLSCHGKPGLTKTNGDGVTVSLYVNPRNVDIAAHRYIDCTTCHTSDPHKVATPLTKLSLAEKCGSCHQYEYKLHLKSIHGQQLTQGNKDVATCVDCHSATSNPHDVIRVLEYNAAAYKKNIAETCAKCHNNESLMADYGIVEKTYESYMRSYHGKAIKLGDYELSQLDEATCVNCHGAHDIKAISDPASPVAGLGNLARTCEQCHEGAGQQFAAGFLGHREASSQNVAPVHYTEVLFKVVLTTVIVFGIIVVIAAVLRFSLNRWRH